MIQLIIWSKVSFWFTKGISLQQRNSGALTEANLRRTSVRWNKILWQQKRTQLPIFNIDFAKENKTQRQQTKYSVAGIFCSNLDLNTAGEKPSSSKSSFDARGSPSRGRYTSLSDII